MNILKKRKGFTLVEVIATIAIISIVFTIAGVLVINIINNVNNQSTTLTKSNILKTAKIYLEEYKNDINWQKEETSENKITCISINELINKNLLKKDIKNNTNLKQYIIIKKDKNSNIISENFDEYGICQDINKIAEIPTNKYCTTPTYNKNKQPIATENKNGFYFTEDTVKATDAGTYKVTAKLEDNYQWTDGTTSDKSINCTIEKASPTIELSSLGSIYKIDETETIKIKSNVTGKLTLKSSNKDYFTATIIGDNKINSSEEFQEKILINFLSSKTAEGHITITLTPDDTKNYYSTSTTFTIGNPNKHQVEIPTTKYCSNPIYNSNQQKIINPNEVQTGITLYNYEQTDINNYEVTAKLKYGYIWSDGTTETKTITCPIKGSITYNGNGTNTKTDSTINTKDTINLNEEYTTKANFYIKTGYTFNNWNENKDGTGQKRNANEKWNWNYTNKNITLYAQWTKNPYTITYECNDGTCDGPTSGIYDTDIVISNPTKTVTIIGNANGTGATIGSATSGAQTFSGWTSSTNAGLDTSTSKTGTTTNPTTSWNGSLTKNTYFKNLRATSGTVTLTANWTATTLKLPTITKEGYTCGWMTKSNGTTIEYASGANYTPSTTSATSITMYGKCEANTATVTINKNGSSWSNSGINVALYNDTKVAYAYSSSTASGSTVSWTGVATGTYNIYASKNSEDKTTLVDTGIDIKVLNGVNDGVNITAIINYYVLTLNKGTEISTVTGAATYLSNQSASIGATTNTGYTFKKWTTNSGNAPTSTTTANTTVSMNKATTLTANATTTTYTIAYKCNDGNCTGPTSGTYDTNVIISNPTKTVTVTGNANGTGATVGTPTSKAQTFSGWTSSTNAGLDTSTSKTGTTTNPTTSWNGSLTKNTYFKNLRATSGTVTLTANWTATTLKLPTITKEGYTCGWMTKSNGTTIEYASGANYTPSETSATSITMYGKCEAKTITVTFHRNTSSSDTTKTTQTFTYGKSGQAFSDPGWTRTGYTNSGWGETANATEIRYKLTVSVKDTWIDANSPSVDVYAVWKANTYTVTYNGNGSTSGSTASSTHTINTDKNLTANGFSKTGYTFNKWNTKADGTGTSYSDKQSVKNLTTTGGATITLYAQWTANTYTIKYNANGGTGTMSDSTHTYNTAKQLTTNSFTKTYSTFNGWNTKADGSGTNYTNKQSVKNLTSANNITITLYAQWKPKLMYLCRSQSEDHFNPGQTVMWATMKKEQYNTIISATPVAIIGENDTHYYVQTTSETKFQYISDWYAEEREKEADGDPTKGYIRKKCLWDIIPSDTNGWCPWADCPDS